MEKILILKVLDLFSGIGGFSLALESTGHFETVAFVEKDEFCQKVLAKNFKGIPIEGDIRNVKGNRYEADVITGGFPCQPFSVAGKRKGTDDDRYLWDETIRVIRECKPRWFIGENVEGIINIQDGMVLRQVQNDLEEEGFEVRCLIVPASSKGAWHHRKRVWILANSNSRVRGRGRAVEQGRANKVWGFCSTKEEQPEYDIRSEAVRCNAVLRKEDVSNTNDTRNRTSKHGAKQQRQTDDKGWKKQPQFESSRHSENVSNTKHQRFSQGMQSKTTSNGNRQRESKSKETWWQTQSRVCGVPNGVSYELDKNRAKRVKALGNSIVPQIVYEIGKAIILAESD